MKLALFLLVKKAQIHVHLVLCEDFGAGWERRNHCDCLKERREWMDYDFLIVGSGFGRRVSVLTMMQHLDNHMSFSYKRSPFFLFRHYIPPLNRPHKP